MELSTRHERCLLRQAEVPTISFGLALAGAVLDYRWQRERHPDDVPPG